MDDMERYGDYNEIDEPPKKSGVGSLLKIMICLLCVVVVGFMGLRILLFNYYPKEMKSLYFNDTLTEFYEANGGNISALTQELRFPYDDADKGRFFADHMVVIREAGQLQVTLRYNTSLIADLEAEYGVDLDEGGEIFSFRLARDPRNNPTDDAPDRDNIGVTAEEVGVLSVNESDSFMIYNYHKLVFDGIDFGSDNEPLVEWLRVEVTINGVEMEEPFLLLVYENNAANSRFTEYTLEKGEEPK